jgi:hypothetical protein
MVLAATLAGAPAPFWDWMVKVMEHVPAIRVWGLVMKASFTGLPLERTVSFWVAEIRVTEEAVMTG